MNDLKVKNLLNKNKYLLAKKWMEEKKQLVKDVYKITDIEKLVLLQKAMDNWYIEGIKQGKLKKVDLDKVFENECKELHIDTNIEMEMGEI